jgi:O-antigen/teichoic acid export membrane protein
MSTVIGSQEQFSPEDGAKPADFFRREMLRAAPWSVSAILLRHAANLIAVVLLARLLTPADFGLAAIVLSVTGLAVIVVQMGLAHAFVAFESSSERLIDSLFWLSIASAVCMYFALASLSGAIARFYALPPLAPLLAIGLAAIVTQNAAALVGAKLQRELNYRSQTLMNSTGPLSMLIVGLPLAASGYGPLALLLPVVVGSVLAVIVGLTHGGLRLRLVFNLRGVKPLLRFSSGIALSNAAVYFCNSGIALVTGRFWPTPTVGLYNFALSSNSKLFEVLASPVSPHLFQIFAKITDDAVLRSKLFAYMRFAQVYLLPLYVLLLLGAQDVFHAIFGERWLEAVPFFQALLMVSIAKVMNAGTSTVIMARRRGAIVMTMSLVRLLGTFTILGLTLMMQWPPLWIVVALALFDSAIYLAFIPIGTRLAGASLADYLATLPTGLGLGLAIGCLFVGGSYLLQTISVSNPWSTVALLGCCAAVHFCIVGLIYRRSLGATLSLLGAQRT